MAESPIKKKEDAKKEKFDWADEGLSAMVRVLILLWSAAILTLNYVTIPWMPQQDKIDPTFIASVFTGTLATFGVQATKKKEDQPTLKEKKDEKIS